MKKKDYSKYLQEIKELNSASGWYQYLHKHYKLSYDKEFILEALKVNGLVYTYFATVDIVADRDVALQALQKNHINFEELEKICPSIIDREFILEVAKKNGRILCMLPSDSEFLKDRDIVLAAVKNHPSAIFDADRTLVSEDEEIMLIALQGTSSAIKIAGKNLRKNRQLALTAVIKNDEETLLYTEKEKERYSIWNYIDDEVKEDPKFLEQVEESRKLSIEEQKERDLLIQIANYARDAANDAQARADLNTYGWVPPDDGISQEALSLLDKLSTKTLENLPKQFGDVYREKAMEILEIRKNETLEKEDLIKEIKEAVEEGNRLDQLLANKEESKEK